MKVIQIEYSALYNTGNYENEKVGLTVQLEEGETVEETVLALRKKTAEMVGPKAMEQVDLKQRLSRAVARMREEAELAAQEYEVAKNFMEAQGLKMDMPAFPMLKTLLPPKDTQPKLPEPDVEAVRVDDEDGPF
jgi:hypothetical protein